MIVRIDTTNITRGREFTLLASNPTSKPITMRGLDVSSGEVVDIPYTKQSLGEFDKYVGVAPQLNGYLLATVSQQKVVKKIGNPQPAFVIGYEANYTVPYKIYNGSGVEVGHGDLTHIVDGFYFTQVPYDTAVIKCLDTYFIINKSLIKMNYEVSITSGTLNSTFETLPLKSVPLPNVQLPTNILGVATLNATSPNIFLKEL